MSRPPSRRASAGARTAEPAGGSTCVGAAGIAASSMGHGKATQQDAEDAGAA